MADLGTMHCIPVALDLLICHCARQSNSLVNILGGEWYVPGFMFICVFAIEDKGKNWDRLGEKPVFPERIKNYLILDHEISLQTRRAFKPWNHTRLQESCLDNSQWFGGETISKTLSQSKSILFTKEQERKSDGLVSILRKIFFFFLEGKGDIRKFRFQIKIYYWQGI